MTEETKHNEAECVDAKVSNAVVADDSLADKVATATEDVVKPTEPVVVDTKRDMKIVRQIEVHNTLQFIQSLIHRCEYTFHIYSRTISVLLR